MGKRESIPDVARVLSRYANIIASRTYSHRTLELLACHASVPVINALSDLEHPCQALADLLTIYEKKNKLQGLTLAFMGDGNNVANSLLLASMLVGMNFNIACPCGYEIGGNILKQAQDIASVTGARILCVDDPARAARGADVLYTDVWTSMGQEKEREERHSKFAGYQIDTTLVSLAKDDVIIMHPLPAHHGQEVEEGILDLPKSVVFDQAENRMHIQKAIMARLLGAIS
jgi:ornithine carbamoyltransferase